MLEHLPLSLAQAMPMGLAFVLLVFGFGFVIFVHEMGHFLVAKAVGIKCSQFAVGFGRPLVAWRKGLGFRIFRSTEPDFDKRIAEGAAAETMGETEYRLNWMPLGGYVKMVGQEDIDPSKAMSDDPRSFMRKPVWARFCVVSAGVVLNAIFAILFFLLAFMYGVEFPAAVVGDVEPGSPAAVTAAVNHPDAIGLRSGDVVTAVNGVAPRDFTDVALAAALTKRGETVSVKVERVEGFSGTSQSLEFQLEPTLIPSIGHKLLSIGVHQPLGTTLAVPSESDAGRALQATLDGLGLRGGMKLVRVNDMPISHIYQLPEALVQIDGQPCRLTFADEQGQVTIDRTPVTGMTPDPKAFHLLGLVPPIKVDFVVPPRKVLWMNIPHPADGKLQAGDLIYKVGATDRPTRNEFLEALQASKSKPLTIEVLREGKAVEVEVTPNSQGKVGIQLSPATGSNVVAGVLPESPFKALDLILPAKILEINGRPVADYSELRRAVAGARGEVQVKYELPLPDETDRVQTRTIQLTDAMQASLRQTPWDVDLPPFQLLQVTHQAENAGQAIEMGFAKTHDFMMQTYATLGALLRRTVPVAELRGPVGIAQAGTNITQRGWTYLMFFLGIISINLAVINFLPFPVLDGGLAVLLLLEKLRGKPVPVFVQTALNFVALVLLLSLFVFVTWNDVSRLITGAG